MGTEILKSFGSLQNELAEARNMLKGVDENIKRLIGRDPSELVPRAPVKRGLTSDETRGRPDDLRNRPRPGQGNRARAFNHENDEPTSKRRGALSVFRRLSERPVQYEEEGQQPQRQMISKVIVTPKEVPSRQEALAAQNSDEKFKARNRRMFGALLGTLQKFQQEETKLKPREEKRAQLEKKIEEHEIREKAEIKKERQELFLNRKKKQAEIKMIELKMLRMKEYATWEEKQKPRANFLTTKAKPHIHFLPRKLNDGDKTALEENKKEIEKMIEKRRQAVFEELKTIEERMKRNFRGKDEKEEEHEDHFSENPDLPVETSLIPSEVDSSMDLGRENGREPNADGDLHEDSTKSQGTHGESQETELTEEKLAKSKQADIKEETDGTQVIGEKVQEPCVKDVASTNDGEQDNRKTSASEDGSGPREPASETDDKLVQSV